MTLRRRDLLLAGTTLLVAPSLRASETLWSQLRAGGLVLLMRHARTTSGVGDPPGFRLDDCTTQRNLDEVGRMQARAWGVALRRNGVDVRRLLSSRWCRCVETAELLGYGPPEPFQPLDSFFAEREGSAASRDGIRDFVRNWTKPGVAVLVTHQVNITAAFGIGAAMGEGSVVEPDDGGGEIIGRLQAPG